MILTRKLMPLHLLVFTCFLLPQCSANMNFHGQFRQRNSLTKEDAAFLIPEMLKATDRITSIDPFHFLRGGGKLQSSAKEAAKARWTTHNQDVPSLDSLSPSRLSRLRNVISSSPTLTRPGSDPDLDIPGDLFILKLLASITPILGDVSEVCFEQGMAYLSYLGEDLFAEWALKMLDSTGKTPDGVLSDIVYFCDFMHSWVQPGFCDTLGSEEAADLANLIIPNGNTIAMGSFEGCWKVVSTKNANDTGDWTDFIGQHCLVDIVGAGTSAAKAKNPVTATPDPRMGGVPWIIGELLPGDVPPSLTAIYLLVSSPKFGVCIPSGCSAADVEANYAELYRSVGARGVVETCETKQTQEELQEFDTAAYIATVVFSIVAVLMLLGTSLDVYKQLSPKHNKEPELAVYGDDDKKDESIVWKLLLCFSVNINGRKILNTDRDEQHYLGCLNGIRVLSMLWIILLHTYHWGTQIYLRNPQKRFNLPMGRNGWGYEFIMNGSYFAVDSFFFLSGLLVAYFAFLEMDKKRFNIVMYYVHRYIRLTIPLAFVTLFAVGIFPLFARGPMAYRIEEYAGFCSDNWWTNLLYINNFVNSGDACIGLTWYLAVDMQFYAVAPLLLYPMHVSTKRDKRWMGLAVWGLFIAVFTVLPGWYTAAKGVSLGSIRQQPPQDFDFNGDWYYMPWMRAQPYLLGIITGYVLWQTKGKDVKMHWTVAVLLWLVAATLACVVIFCTYIPKSNGTFLEPAFSAASAAAYNSLSKLTWGFVLMWVVLACVKGYGGIINSFLSWGFFKPLARINYITYLCHQGLIKCVFFALTYTVEFTDIIAAYYFVGFAMISYGIAFVGSLMVESPFISMEKIILGGGKGNEKKDYRENDIFKGTPDLSRDAMEEKMSEEKTKPIDAFEVDDSGVSSNSKENGSNSDQGISGGSAPSEGRTSLDEGEELHSGVQEVKAQMHSSSSEASSLSGNELRTDL